MKYNNLGRSGLKVSQLSFGSWLTFADSLNAQSATQCMKYAFEQGVNFFDNAEVYMQGASELLMGKAIKNFRREELVISTKIYWSGDGPNDVGLSRKHLIEATKNSLKRLELDYVDLIYCHRPDLNTPIEETVRAMDYIIRKGQAFYWGTSEWGADQIRQAYEIAGKLGCIPPTMEQPQYNLFCRKRVEEEYFPLYKEFGLGLTTWSPLAFGLLTGKYNKEIPADSRLGKHPEWRDGDMVNKVEMVKRIQSIAKELNCSIAQLAIAWCLKNPNVSSVILGASNINQLQENMNALHVIGQLTSDVIKKIEEVVNQQ